VTKELLKTGKANTSSDVYDLVDMKPFVSEVKSYIKILLGKG
jgi:hypothetical protein